MPPGYQNGFKISIFDLFVLKEFAVPIALRTNGNGVTLRELVSSTLDVVVEVLQLHFNHP